MKDHPRLTALCALALTAIPLSAAVMALALRDGLFWGDHIGLFAETRLHETFSLRGLFAFHNEHIVVPMKLAVWADLRAFGGEQWLTLALALLLAAAPPVVCAILLAREQPALGRESLAFCGALFGALYFNGMLLWDLTWPILLQHFFAVAAVLGLAAILARGDLGSWRGALAALALCGAAALSNANGALTPVVLGLVLVFRRKERLLWLPVAGIALITVPYFLAYRSTHSAMSPPRAAPWETLHFALLFTGGAYWRDSEFPYESRSEPALVYLTAISFCLLLAWLVLGLWRRRGRLTAFEVFHLTLIVFVVTTALAGGLFRSQFGAWEGLNKKYAATAFLAWLAAASLLLRSRPGLLFGSPWRPAAFALALLATLLPAGWSEFQLWRRWNERVRECTVSAASSAPDVTCLRSLYWNVRRGAEVLASLQRQRKGFVGKLPLAEPAQQPPSPASSMK